MESSISAINVKRVYDSQYWDDRKPEWLPRAARFDVQIGPLFERAGVWRELQIEISSGPEHLYRYFPFSCFVYVNDRAATVLEFDEPLQRLTAKVCVPIGESFNVRIVSELGDAPAKSGHGTDTRELALQFWGMSTGPVVPAPRSVSSSRETVQDLSITGEREAQPQPIFVVGAYRSATSVLTWALGQHPNIWPMEENGWLPMFAYGALGGYRNATTAARSFFDVYDVSKPEYMSEMGRAIDEFCQRISRRHLHGILLRRLSGKGSDYNSEFQLARSVMNPKRRWVDGTPEHSAYIGVLRELFPRAQFVALVRDPIDVVSSMLRFDRAGGERLDVKAAANMWLRMTRSVLLAYGAYGPDVVHLVRHMSLVDDPAATLQTMFDFLGEPDFPKAADTFNKRINSSKIEDVERSELRTAIDNEPEIKSNLLQQYDEVLAAIEATWVPDIHARHQLAAFENDVITRMMATLQG